MLPANAAEEFAASFSLRGGYDSNPLLSPQAKSSPLIAWEAAAAYGHDSGEWIAGASAEASLTRYREQEFDPLQNYRLRLRLANKNQNDISLDATTTLAHFSNYDTRNENAQQRVHLQWVGGNLRPFAAGDVRFASLNELNVLLGEFLPEPMRYLRGTITSGVAYVRDKSEVGISLGIARTKYEQEFDLFDFRRDNDRIQPSLYVKHEENNLAFSGSVSFLRVYSQDPFFTDVNAILFDASFARKWDGWNADISLARTAEDTTFPVSPATINMALQAKLMREIDGKTHAGPFARVLHRKYWDSPFFSRVRLAGAEITREIAADVSLAVQVGFSRSLLISGAEADGVIATFALTKRFSSVQKNSAGEAFESFAR